MCELFLFYPHKCIYSRASTSTDNQRLARFHTTAQCRGCTRYLPDAFCRYLRWFYSTTRQLHCLSTSIIIRSSNGFYEPSADTATTSNVSPTSSSERDQSRARISCVMGGHSVDRSLSCAIGMKNLPRYPTASGAAATYSWVSAPSSTERHLLKNLYVRTMNFPRKPNPASRCRVSLVSTTPGARRCRQRRPRPRLCRTQSLGD